MRLNAETLSEAIAITWRIAHEQNTIDEWDRWWRIAYQELDGMVSLIIYAAAGREIMEDAQFLREVARTLWITSRAADFEA